MRRAGCQVREVQPPESNALTLAGSTRKLAPRAEINTASGGRVGGSTKNQASKSDTDAKAVMKQRDAAKRAGSDASSIATVVAWKV